MTAAIPVNSTLAESNTNPEAAQVIKVRRMDMEFPDSIAEFWFDGDPMLTMVMTAMSVSFPAGERFFIDSVRHYQEQIDDPVLKAQIRAFIGQEANHTKEHIAMNDFMQRKGYPAKGMEDFVRNRITTMQKRWTPAECLASTVALEHFTAIMAGAFLDHPEALEKMDPHMARIWAWHAIEEAEHKAVAFDVYQQTVNDEALRKRAMVKMTLLFLIVNTARTLILMQRAGHLFNLRSWWKGSRALWGRDGIFRKIFPDYLAFYRKDFHPWQHDNRVQVDAMKARYLGDKA